VGIRRDGEFFRESTRALVAAAVVFAAFATIVALVAVEPERPPLLQGLDDSSRDLALRAPTWAERASELLRTLGSGIVMVPLRIGVAIWLLARRRRSDVVAWLLAWALADAVTTALKLVIGRSHPDGSDGATSFPSAHAKTAAQVALGLVLVATSPRRGRLVWWTIAFSWIAVMAVSRTVVDEHWLSDVLAGSLLGAACAIGSAAIVQRLRPAGVGSRHSPTSGYEGVRTNDQKRDTGSNPSRE
jgi:membrane-associated phospholipid phosphatase